jgi:hypothetical protein
MPKTRRTKINRSPLRPFRNAMAVVLNNGEKKKKHKDAKPRFEGVVLTGIPRGKVYPYAGKKRGGGGGGYSIRPRKEVRVTG